MLDRFVLGVCVRDPTVGGPLVSVDGLRIPRRVLPNEAVQGLPIRTSNDLQADVTAPLHSTDHDGLVALVAPSLALHLAAHEGLVHFYDALQKLGVPTVGLAGSTAAATMLAKCLGEAQFQRTGFCGLFFPVLEDTVLAESAAEGCLSIGDLMLFSTVCGAGLDTIPLPGDIRVDDLYAILVDLGSLALRHEKQLTARLMPIPGKSAGDDIHFDFPYFADSRVMPIKTEPLADFLQSETMLDITPNPPRDGGPKNV